MGMGLGKMQKPASEDLWTCISWRMGSPELVGAFFGIKVRAPWQRFKNTIQWSIELHLNFILTQIKENIGNNCGKGNWGTTHFYCLFCTYSYFLPCMFWKVWDTVKHSCSSGNKTQWRKILSAGVMQRKKKAQAKCSHSDVGWSLCEASGAWASGEVGDEWGT